MAVTIAVFRILLFAFFRQFSFTKEFGRAGNGKRDIPLRLAHVTSHFDATL